MKQDIAAFEAWRKGNHVLPSELTRKLLEALQGAPYSAGTAALVTVLAVRIGRHGKQPLLDAQVYGAVLKTLVEAISGEMAARGGATDVAA